MERLWADAESAYRRNILATLTPAPAAVLLDVGCDDGAWTDELRSRLGIPPQQVHGLELVPERAELARERGFDVREVRHDREGDYHTLLRVTAETAKGPRSVAGTLFGNRAPRLIELFGVKVEADLAGDMLYVVNEDAPGFIGRLGTTLGEANINIGTFHLGRVDSGGEAVLLLSVDEPVGPDVIATVERLPGVKLVRPLKF